MNHRLVVLGLTLPFLTAAPSQAQVSRERQVALMDSIAESPVIERRVAGLAVAVIRGTDTLLMKGYGRADLEWNVPMPVDAVFEIGSVTKQFTAAAILKLRDQGRLDLDADVTAYLPDFPTQGHRIPVRRLLDHTSGIRGATEIDGFRNLRGQDLAPRDTALKIIGAEPLDFPPGEALIYNNSAYIMLGHIIEKASGMSYENYVEQELFAPLGMTRSSYCSNTDVVERRARGYSLRPDGLVNADYTSHLWPYAAGSLCSTVGDMVAWLRALHGGKVLPEATYREMITPKPLNDGTPVRYAMGLSVTPDVGGRAVIGHGGAISGFLSETRWYPEQDLIVVMLVNTTGNLSPGALSNEIVDVLVPRLAPVTHAFTGDASPFLGTYSGPSRGRALTVTVRSSDQGLQVVSEGNRPAPLRWTENWTFRLGPVQVVTFEREGDTGPATVMRMDGGGSHYVLRRQPD